MELRGALFNALVQLIEHADEVEPTIQPSLPVSDDGLTVVPQPNVGLTDAQQYWSFIAEQSDKSFTSQRLVREDDCEASLLGDFYQRASLLSPTAANQVCIGSQSIVSRLQNRWLQDIQILQALAAEENVYVCTLKNNQHLCFYQIDNAQTLRALLWNNLVRFYSEAGIGWIEQASTLEQQFAQELQEQAAGANMLFVFANQSFCLQIHQSTGWFLHACDALSDHKAKQRLESLSHIPFHWECQIDALA